MIHSIKEWYLWLVLENFINTPIRGAERAQENARYYRDVGLGTVGWHSYLQKERAILRKDKVIE